MGWFVPLAIAGASAAYDWYQKKQQKDAERANRRREQQQMDAINQMLGHEAWQERYEGLKGPMGEVLRGLEEEMRAGAYRDYSADAGRSHALGIPMLVGRNRYAAGARRNIATVRSRAYADMMSLAGRLQGQQANAAARLLGMQMDSNLNTEGMARQRHMDTMNLAGTGLELYGAYRNPSKTVNRKSSGGGGGVPRGYNQSYYNPMFEGLY